MKPSAVKMREYMRSNSTRSYRGCRSSSTCFTRATHAAATTTHSAQGHTKFPIARSRIMNVVAFQFR